MPTYEYECRSCGAEFERVYSMADMPRTVKCECGKMAKRAIKNRTGIVRQRFYDTARQGRGRGGR